MSAQKDYRSDLDDWMDMWGEMEKAGHHPSPERVKPRPTVSREDLADPYNTNHSQDAYFDYLDAAEELLAEEKTPNPVYPDSVGPDSKIPDPVWVDDDLLKEVERLRERMFKVENEVARMGQGKKWTEKTFTGTEGNSLMDEIKSMRQQLDKVSSQLGVRNEPSPWQTPPAKNGSRKKK